MLYMMSQHSIYLMLLFPLLLDKNIFLLLNSLAQTVFPVETLNRRWKNLLDGFTRCLKKIKDNQGSGSANIKIPTCRFFKKLEFLKNKVENK